MAAQSKEKSSDVEIAEAHRRYVKAMEARLPTISEETRKNYLSVITSLAAKLEVPGKPLSEIVREMMAEATPLIFQSMQS